MKPTFADAFTISGKITVQGDGGAANIPISISGTGGTTTAPDGNYSLGNLPAGFYSVGVGDVTQLYNIVSGTSPTLVTVGPDQTVNYVLSPSGTSATGTIFNDSNGNGVQDTGEEGVGGVTITYTRPFVPTSSTITDSNGHFSLYVLNVGSGGQLTITTPSGYTNTTPTSDPLGSSGLAGSGHNFGIKQTATPTPSSTPTSTSIPPSGGNIINLNFGITNNNPWFQSSCGDIREDNGITDILPAGQLANITDATCSTPGISLTGDTDATYGNGQESVTNQQVGGASYPEVFSSSTALQTSYPSLLSKAQSAGILPTDLATVCDITNCYLPSNLPHGIYIANDDVMINSYNFQNNNSYVFLIKGTLTINGALSIPDNPNASTVLFSTTKNIIVSPTVGSPVNCNCTTIAGWFIAGQNFIVQTQGNCNDLRLNIAGTVVANALGTGGTFQNNRDLCGSDTTDPTVSFSQQLNMILNAPQFLKHQTTISQELAP